MPDTGIEPRPDHYLQVMAEPCPCDECRFFAKCGTEKLLCERFSMYVNGEGRPRWSLAPRAPTKSRFVALFDYRALNREKKLRAARLLRRQQARAPGPAI